MNKKKNKNQNVDLDDGNYNEKIEGDYIQGDQTTNYNGNFNQFNIFIDKLKSSKNLWLTSIILITITVFPAYFKPIQLWVTRNSNIEITNYEGANNDKISLIVTNSGKKPGSIGSAWLRVEGLLKDPVKFPFDNGNSISNSNLFLKSGEEKRITLTPPKNWQDISNTSHISKIIERDIMPKIDTMNGQPDDLGFSCTLDIEVNQTGTVESVTKEIKSQWKCLQAIGLFVDLWEN